MSYSEFMDDSSYYGDPCTSIKCDKCGLSDFEYEYPSHFERMGWILTATGARDGHAICPRCSPLKNVVIARNNSIFTIDFQLGIDEWIQHYLK